MAYNGSSEKNIKSGSKPASSGKKNFSSDTRGNKGPKDRTLGKNSKSGAKSGNSPVYADRDGKTRGQKQSGRYKESEETTSALHSKAHGRPGYNGRTDKNAGAGRSRFAARPGEKNPGGMSGKPAGGSSASYSGEKNKSKKGAGKVHSKKTGFSAPRDGFDDIKSFGGRYVELPDFDEFDGSPAAHTWESKTDDRPQKRSAEIRRDSGSPEIADAQDSLGVVAGRNAVRELLRSGRSVDKLFVKNGSREGSIVVIVSEAISRGIPVVEVAGDKLDSLAGDVHHQGVVAMASQKQYTDVDGILAIAEEREETPLVVIADNIEDPHNLGALIRCAECAGAHGVIIPKRRSAGLTPVAAKASAGAIEHMAVAKVSNISQTIEQLKKKGLWIFASEADGMDFYEADFTVPSAIVFGSEGFGVSRGVRDKCDYVVSIPMYGKVNSLNVSTAASVILSRAARIQHGKLKG